MQNVFFQQPHAVYRGAFGSPPPVAAAVRLRACWCKQIVPVQEQILDWSSKLSIMEWRPASNVWIWALLGGVFRTCRADCRRTPGDRVRQRNCCLVLGSMVLHRRDWSGQTRVRYVELARSPARIAASFSPDLVDAQETERRSISARASTMRSGNPWERCWWTSGASRRRFRIASPEVRAAVG